MTIKFGCRGFSCHSKTREACQANEILTTEILLELLRGNADPNARRAEKSTALHEAARRGPIEAVEVLLKVGVLSISSLLVHNHRPSLITHPPLRLLLAAYFLQFKADDEAVNEFGHTPVLIANASKKTEAAQLIEAWPRLRREFSESE